jgi:hypothetical protein
MWLILGALIVVMALVVFLPGPMIADDPDDAEGGDERVGEYPTRSCHLGGVCDQEGRAIRLGKPTVFCSKCWRKR